MLPNATNPRLIYHMIMGFVDFQQDLLRNKALVNAKGLHNTTVICYIDQTLDI